MSKVYEHAMKIGIICVLFVFKLKVNGVQCCFGPQWISLRWQKHIVQNIF